LVTEIDCSTFSVEVQMDAPSVAKHYLELRLLRYVIAVAEELHFGRAAKRLHLSAPALSKQIKDLERDLSYALFERRTREVLLTPGGAAFVAEARQALVRVERAVECGYTASRGDSGVFSLGYSPWFRPSLLVPLQAAFAERVPGTRLALHSAYSTTQIELLLKGGLQAGIIELPTSEEGLETHGVWHDELVAALPENHRLASNSEIDRQDLAEEPIIWIARALHPALHNYLQDSRQRLGYMPRMVHEINTLSELLDLVAAGAGIGFVKMSVMERVREPGVVFRPLSGPKLFIDTGVTYRSDNRSEALRVLIQLLREQST
jgi:DNA-binding transcriptional LysR family regulator